MAKGAEVKGPGIQNTIYKHKAQGRKRRLAIGATGAGGPDGGIQGLNSRSLDPPLLLPGPGRMQSSSQGEGNPRACAASKRSILSFEPFLFL